MSFQREEEADRTSIGRSGSHFKCHVWTGSQILEQRYYLLPPQRDIGVMLRLVDTFPLWQSAGLLLSRYRVALATPSHLVWHSTRPSLAVTVALAITGLRPPYDRAPDCRITSTVSRRRDTFSSVIKLTATL